MQKQENKVKKGRKMDRGIAANGRIISGGQ